MKKISSMLAVTVLAAAIGNVYAADQDSCPNVWTLRDSGSNFSHAFHESHSGGGKNVDWWVITSDPFLYGDSSWQTAYVARMPGISDPEEAVTKGQHDYNYSVLMTKPEVSVIGSRIQCQYSPDGADYFVFAVNEIITGYKKFK